MHAAKVEDLYRLHFGLRLAPKPLLAQALKSWKPFKLLEVKSIRSITGQEVSGVFVGCPLLPRQMVELNLYFVLNKILASCRLAEDLGAKIIGLGGYTSIMVERNPEITAKLSVPVTSGNTYTAYAVLEAVRQNVASQGIDLAGSAVAVIGATGAIGSLCSRKIAPAAARLIITARHRDKLEDLRRNILAANSKEVVIADDAHQAAESADIAIVTTSTPEALLDINEFKDGAIVCDVSVPMNVNGRLKPGRQVRLLKGGLVRLPCALNISRYSGLPGNVIYACAAETMLLTFEQRFSDSCLGKNIALEKLDEVAAMARKHGFEIIREPITENR